MRVRTETPALVASRRAILEMLLSNYHDTGYQTGGSGGDEIPIESISLNFAKIEFEYYEQDAKGNVKLAGKATYDLRAVKAE